LGFTVVSYGEALWDLLPTGAVLGGAPLNFAYRINSLGNRGVIISRLGRDELGQRALKQIAVLGMERSFIQADEKHPTGRVEICFDDSKNPDYTIIEDVAYDHIELQDRLLNLISQSDCLCFGTLAQRSPTSRKTLWRLLDEFSGSFAFLDINLRRNCYSEETICHSLNEANVVKLNEEELNVLAEIYGLGGKSLPEIVQSLVKKATLKYCVVSLGHQGAFAASNDGEMVYAPGFQVDLADPCGAGDAFSAGFIHSLLNEEPLQDACRFGNALGALVARQQGATQPITHQEIKDFVAGRKCSSGDARLRDLLV